MTQENLFFIKTQTPLHIGCDEVYEPVSFVVDEDQKVLISFDPMEFFSRLSEKDKKEFSAISPEGTIQSLLELNKFMRGKKANGFPVAVCDGFIDHYRDNLAMKSNDVNKIQQEINQFEIKRTAFLENTNEPYIPGSAVKGALRTACLNALAKKTERVDYNSRDKAAASQLEKKLLKFTDPGNDPFRMVKVSDFLPVCFDKRIVYAINVKKKSSGAAKGLSPILEVIEPGAVFVGTLKVEQPLSKETGIQMPLSLPDVLKSAAFFYSKEKQREEKELSQAGLPVAKLQMGGEHYPMRIGRHSGAESVTIEGYRDIKIMCGKGRTTFSNKGAGTFWLAAERKKDWNKMQLQPFGWVCLGKVDEKLAAEFDQLKEKQKDKANNVRSNPLTKGEPSGSLESVPPIPPPPVEDVWDNAQVSYDAGGAGKISAQMQGKPGASLAGKGNRENLKAAVAEGLHKNLFERKKPVKARVTVRKTGNAWEIVKIEPAG